uniref:ribosome recycling factor n=1 Tax=Bacillus mycoides TaxID=1405 RepID=UPI00119CE655
YAEEAKVAVGNVGGGGNEDVKKVEKGREIREDELRGYGEDMEKERDKYIGKVEEMAKKKEKEMMEV